MRTVLLSVFALFASLALLVSGNALLGTMIALRISSLGVSSSYLGAILACYSVGFVLGASYGTSIIRGVGHIRAFAVYAAFACVTSLLYPVFDNLIAWAVMRLVTGYCLAGLMTVMESWINDRATNESRGKLLGIYTINFYLASSVGQLLVAWSDPDYFIAYTLVAILVVLSLVPLSLTRGLIPSAPSPTHHLQLSRFIRQAPSGITGAVASGLAISAFIGLAPVYAANRGLSLPEISSFMSFSVICAIALQWPAGWMSDRYGRLPVLVGLLACAAISALLVISVGQFSQILVFLFSGLFFAFTASIYPVSVALANDQLPNDQLVAACAAMLLLYGFGSIAGPILAGLGMQLLGPSTLFLLMAIILAVSAAAIQFFFHAGDKVPLAEQGDFVTISPVSTPVLTEIDPRNEEFEQHHPGEPADWDLADKMEMLIPEATPGFAESDTPSTQAEN
jgi:MFS family permease